MITKRDAGQKLYYLIVQWLRDSDLALWMSKATGRHVTVWATYIQYSLFFKTNKGKSEMLDEFIENGYILFMQLSAGRYPKTRYDIKDCR